MFRCSMEQTLFCPSICNLLSSLRAVNVFRQNICWICTVLRTHILDSLALYLSSYMFCLSTNRIAKWKPHDFLLELVI